MKNIIKEIVEVAMTAFDEMCQILEITEKDFEQVEQITELIIKTTMETFRN